MTGSSTTNLSFLVHHIVKLLRPLSAERNQRVQNIVLVHGAWADGSGWKGVYDILVKDGYKVSIVQEPETFFKVDVAATKRVLAQQDGPCILVAHGYGGSRTYRSRKDPPGWRFGAHRGHMPDVGENEAGDGKRFPSEPQQVLCDKENGRTVSLVSTLLSFMSTSQPTLPAEQAAFMGDRRC